MYMINLALILDDDPFDLMLTNRAVKKSGICENNVLLRNPVEALEYCFKLKQGQNPATPDMMIIDINMPEMTGFEFMEGLKKINFDFTKTAIVILTSSFNQRDVDKAKNLGVPNFFVNKPLTAPNIKSQLADVLAFLDNSSKS